MNENSSKSKKTFFIGCALGVIVTFIGYLFIYTFLFVNSGWLYFLNNQGDGFRLGFSYPQKIHLDLPTIAESYSPPLKGPEGNISAYTILKVDVMNDEKNTYIFYDSDEKGDHSDIDGITIFASFDAVTFNKNWQLEYKSRPTYIVKNTNLYVIGCSFAQKIDLPTGKNIWKQEYNFTTYYSEPCYDSLKFEGANAIIYDSKGQPTIINEATGNIEPGSKTLGSPSPASTSQISPVLPS